MEGEENIGEKHIKEIGNKSILFKKEYMKTI